MESLSPNLMVSNVNEAVVYYEEKLGFSLTMSVPDAGVYDWAMVTNGNAVIMFQTRESIAEDTDEFDNMPIGGTLAMYIRIKEIEKFMPKLKTP